MGPSPQLKEVSSCLRQEGKDFFHIIMKVWSNRSKKFGYSNDHHSQNCLPDLTEDQ